MEKKILSLLLYPACAYKIKSEQVNKIYDIINNEIKDITIDEIVTGIKEMPDFDKIVKSLPDIANEDGLKYFYIAKEIVELIEVSKLTLVRLAEVGTFLKVDSAKTDFEFDIYDLDCINKYEFKKALRKFSAVSAAVGFIPGMHVAGFAILTSIQVGLLAKITTIYHYKLDPKEFLKLIGSSIGTGIISKIISHILRFFLAFIPIIGWAINAAVAYASTYAIGIIAKSYIKANGELTKDSIKDIWHKSYEEGREEFKDLQEYILKKKEEFMKEMEKYKKKSSIDMEENLENDDELDD